MNKEGTARQIDQIQPKITPEHDGSGRLVEEELKTPRKKLGKKERKRLESIEKAKKIAETKAKRQAQRDASKGITRAQEKIAKATNPLPDHYDTQTGQPIFSEEAKRQKKGKTVSYGEEAPFLNSIEETKNPEINKEARHHIWDLMHQMKMGLEEKDAKKLGRLASRIREEFGIDLDTAREIYREETRKLTPEKKPKINTKTIEEKPKADVDMKVVQTTHDSITIETPTIRPTLNIPPTMQSDTADYQPKENWIARKSREAEEAIQKKADAKYQEKVAQIEQYEPEESPEATTLQNKLQEQLQYLKNVYGIKMDMEGKMGFFSRRKWKKLLNTNNPEFHSVTDKITKMQTELANFMAPMGEEKEVEPKAATPRLGEVDTTPWDKEDLE